MVKVIHHLIFQRKHGLIAETLTSTQSFPLVWGGGPLVIPFNTFSYQNPKNFGMCDPQTQGSFICIKQK